jgi:acyl dehydratase
MPDKDLIGKTYGPETHEVTDDEVEAYLEATDDENPVWETPNSPVPPMFAAVYAREVMSEVLFDDDLALDLPKLVHGAQDFRFESHVHVGDEITTEGELAEWFTRDGNEVVTVKTTSTNQDDEVVTVGTWTFVVRGAAEGED